MWHYERFDRTGPVNPNGGAERPSFRFSDLVVGLRYRAAVGRRLPSERYSGGQSEKGHFLN